MVYELYVIWTPAFLSDLIVYHPAPITVSGLLASMLFLNHPNVVQISYFLCLEHRNSHGLSPPLFRSLLRRHFIEESFPVDAAWAFIPLSPFLPPTLPQLVFLSFLALTTTWRITLIYLCIVCLPHLSVSTIPWQQGLCLLLFSAVSPESLASAKGSLKI